MSDTILTDLQADIAERLRADAFFADVGVYDERRGDLESDLSRSLGLLTEVGGKVGVCAVVLSPVGDDTMPDAPWGPLEVTLTVRVLENVLINSGSSGTGKAALTVARRIHRILKLYRPSGLAQSLVPVKPTIVPVEDAMAPLAYEVRFRATEADPEQSVKVLQPVFSPNGGAAPQTVTLACATAGASIYYTVDGSHPRAGNAEATLYAGPFSVATAKTVRAAAFKAGCVGSDVNMAVFS